MSHIIDPFNDQHAIADDGQLDQKATLFIPGPNFDPAHPRISDLQGQPTITVYGRFNLGTEESDA